MGSLHVHIPLYQKSQSKPSIYSKNCLICRFNRHKVGRTDMSSLVEFLAIPGRTDAVSVLPDPPVVPAQGRYTDMTFLSHFPGTAGSTDALSVLPIRAAGLYKPRDQGTRVSVSFLTVAPPHSSSQIREGISKTSRGKCF
jgi:hypothetical protein